MEKKKKTMHEEKGGREKQIWSHNNQGRRFSFSEGERRTPSGTQRAEQGEDRRFITKAERDVLVRNGSLKERDTVFG